MRAAGQKVPVLDRGQHAGALQAELEVGKQALAAAAGEWRQWEHIRERGLVLEIESVPRIDVDPKDLDKPKYGFQLLNTKRVTTPDRGPIQYSTWFVPEGKLPDFERLLAEYAAAAQGNKGHRVLVDSIAHLRVAAAQQLWTEPEPWPEANAAFWFECWLRAPDPDARVRVLEQFRVEAERVGIKAGMMELRLREHTVLMAFGTPQQFTVSSALLACVSELRRGRDIAGYTEALSVDEQAAWAAELAARIELPADDLAICVLDTGVNRGHPILSAALPEADNQTIRPAWGGADDHGGRGHGTPMAGICLLGDVDMQLAGNDQVRPPAVLEGVKIVPPPALKNTDEKAAGAYTAQGIATAEIHRPQRRRVWCLATSMEGPNDGKPSSWSAELDQLAAGIDREDRRSRLIVLAAGNVAQEQWGGYPAVNFSTTPDNPAQAWNPLVVGAYTSMAGDPQLHDVGPPWAPPGSLAPCSPTSRPWGEDRWPYRPDVVFEGGNAETAGPGNVPLMRPDLQPLSLSADFTQGAFCSFGGTSPAAAQASHFAACLWREYPAFRPETLRALICHSAEWFGPMRAQLDPALSEKQKHQQLLRTFGYGVPNLDRALATSRSRVTLVAERALQPFHRERGVITPYQMDVFALPWAGAALAANPHAEVTIKVTLSYFVEPNPGNRGYSSIYRYAGCQLRFRVSDPGQERADLVSAVSAAAENNDAGGEPAEAPRFPPDPRWQLGPKGATRGSLHSDAWKGTAAEAADMKHIAVYPMTGWWRTRPQQGKVNAVQPYSLIVTLECPGQDIDLYTEIAAEVAIAADVIG